MVADVIKELEEDSVQVQGVVEINDQMRSHLLMSMKL